MSLATTLMAVGIPAETANRLGYADRVPLDGNGVAQLGATEILRDNTNIAMGTSVGDTAFILPDEAELFQPYFLLNTTADTALIFPPVGDTIDAEALNASVSAPLDTARIIWRVEEGRWVSLSTGVAQETGIVASVVAGAGISVDSTDPANPVVSNTGVLSVTAGTGISVGGTAQNPSIANAGVLSVSPGANISITGTAQAPVINGNAGTVTAVSVATANGLAGSSSGGTTPQLTLSTTVTGILQGNGTAISGAPTTGSGDVVLATSPTLVTPNLGTPSAAILTNATGLPVSTGISGLGTGVATFLATPSSANLAAAVTGETGTGALVFGTAPTLDGPIVTANFLDLQVGQIRFPATPNPSSDANTLDEYEEGTFTPAFAATGATFSYAFRNAVYVKIGKLVFIAGQININTSGNTLNGNDLTVTGLPFASTAAANTEISIRWVQATSSFVNVMGEIGGGGSSIILYGITAAGVSLNTTAKANTLLHATNGSIVWFSAAYEAGT